MNLIASQCAASAGFEFQTFCLFCRAQKRLHCHRYQRRAYRDRIQRTTVWRPQNSNHKFCFQLVTCGADAITQFGICALMALLGVPSPPITYRNLVWPLNYRLDYRCSRYSKRYPYRWHKRYFANGGLGHPFHWLHSQLARSSHLSSKTIGAGWKQLKMVSLAPQVISAQNAND